MDPHLNLILLPAWGKMCHILQVCCLTLVAEAALGWQQGWQQFETVNTLSDTEWQPQVLSIFVCVFVCY